MSINDVLGKIEVCNAEQFARDARWHRHFLEMAEHVGSLSKDNEHQVGSIIVLDRRVLGSGYNGFPRGVKDDPERYEVKAVKRRLIVHAEANAIINALRVSLVDSTLYTTRSPCTDCVKLIIQCGIHRVIAPAPPSGDSYWAEDAQYAEQMMAEVGIERRIAIYEAYGGWSVRA